MRTQARDTIAALSSAPGSAGIAVLRLSGPRAFQIAATLLEPRAPLAQNKTAPQAPSSTQNAGSCAAKSRSFLSPEDLHHFLPHRQATLARIMNSQGELIDHGLVLAFHAPRSYTGEDLIEFHVHGSPFIVNALMTTLLVSAAPAEPGEFTRRAVENGRMDLAQAEGVGALIASDSAWAHQLALRAMDGETSRKVEALRLQVIHLLARLEAELDFSTNEIDELPAAFLRDKIAVFHQTLARWRSTWSAGRLNQGAQIVLLGEPNAGKSSLMNALLGENRVIVNPNPGTTRDMVAQSCQMGRLRVHLWDTAGLRDSSDPIEQEGVRRALDKAASADLVLLLLPPESKPPLALKSLDVPVLHLLTKADLAPPENPPFSNTPNELFVSAKTGQGLDDLRLTIEKRLIGEVDLQSELVLSEWRHAQLLDLGIEALGRADELLSIEGDRSLVAGELRDLAEALGAIHGGFDVEEVLDSVFSQFCIGK